MSYTEATIIASGDLRLSANRVCWEMQDAVERQVIDAMHQAGCHEIRRIPARVDPEKGHGFIDSQKMGREVFRQIPPTSPVVVAFAAWQYSHHVLGGLMRHKGPVLNVANWSGTWPGLVGMLNMNGSLTKAGRAYATLWSEDFSDNYFKSRLAQWVNGQSVVHDDSHVHALQSIQIPAKADQVGRHIGRTIEDSMPIMGVFDEGCMGMYNAIIPDHLLNQTGVFKERLSQSSLYYETLQVTDQEAEACLAWLQARGMKFQFGTDEASELTHAQSLKQCKMYIAAVRIADDFGCDTIGIQYQQGLKDLLPASDLAEGLLNNADRPPVYSRDGHRILYESRPLPHFNEVDECAGLDGLITDRLWSALGYPSENTLHDLRWGEQYGDQFVWVLEISGAAPPAHFIDGYAGAVSERQPPMYFRLGGGSVKGISKPGEIIWSRIYVADDKLKADLGRASVVQLPKEETQRRWEQTTPQWPIMHAVLNGVSRDQMMGRHKANHIQVVYVPDEADATLALFAKAAAFDELGIETSICGDGWQDSVK